MRLDDWFLTCEERGNAFSTIDTRHQPPRSWSEGNAVRPLVDGSTYFTRLAKALANLKRGDQLRFTDWRSDEDECLDDRGSSLRELVSAACQRGCDVRSLLWRSHSDRLAFSAKENRRFALEINRSGGEVVLDERVRRGGSHHQKLVLFRHPTSPRDDVAFVGGIDLCHGRHDDARHHGDQQIIALDQRYGARPAWHDVQLEIRGPAIDDLDETFRERWDDPTPLNHAGHARALFSRFTRHERHASPLPAPLSEPPADGRHAVQILRTYPARPLRYPFAPAGERSVARGFAKAIERARALIYIEDQYFWSSDMAILLARALRRHSQLHVIVLVPRFPDKDGRLSGPPSRLAQERAMNIVKAAGGDRVGFFDLENDEGTPVYVHAKVCVIDDVWATVGSDNLNRRSWTHDSELSCAVIDAEHDTRAPLDPGGLGDGSRKFARDLRLGLWGEHLARSSDDPEILEVRGALALWKSAAAQLEAWSSGPRTTERPPSRIRTHVLDSVSPLNRPWALLAYRLIFDPDGRPFTLRITRKF